MKVIQLKKFPIYDLFPGIGWEGWTRILIDKAKRVTVIAGQQITRDLQAFALTAPLLAKGTRDVNQAVMSKIGSSGLRSQTDDAGLLLATYGG